MDSADANANNSAPRGAMLNARLAAKRSASRYSIIPPIQIILPAGGPTSRDLSIRTFRPSAIGPWRQNKRRAFATGFWFIAARQRENSWRQGLRALVAVQAIIEELACPADAGRNWDGGTDSCGRSNQS